MGITDFVLKIWYLKVHAYFEKSVLAEDDCHCDMNLHVQQG